MSGFKELEKFGSFFGEVYIRSKLKERKRKREVKYLATKYPNGRRGNWLKKGQEMKTNICACHKQCGETTENLILSSMRSISFFPSRSLCLQNFPANKEIAFFSLLLPPPSTRTIHLQHTFFPLMELLAALLCLVSYQVALTISIPKVVISITNAIFALSLSLSLGFTLINNERQNRSWLCLTDDLSCPLGRCFHPNLRMCSDFSGEKTRVTCKVHVEGKRLICAS